ncbi:Na+/H+ antiporter NhaA [Patescibacteria group bacterium]|nr:Na+/H+ antiporter NhaA [Patescibacteria group bacterium]
MPGLRNGVRFLLENSLFPIGGTAVALIFANLNHESYHHIVHAEAAPHINLHFIVNDVLMCFFFAIAAKEIWNRNSVRLTGTTLTIKPLKMPAWSSTTTAPLAVRWSGKVKACLTAN